MNWISNNVSTIIVSFILAVIVLMILRSMRKGKQNGQSSCGCSCGDCSVAGLCHENGHSTRSIVDSYHEDNNGITRTHCS